MRITKVIPQDEAVKKVTVVNKKEKACQHLQAKKIVDTLLPQYSQSFHKVITNEPDRAFVIAWHRYGSLPAVRQVKHTALYTSLDGMTPLGHLSLLALALGLLGKALPEGIQSARAPRHD